METYGIIYKVTNLINGKIYIGQTVRTLEERINQHFYDADKVDGFIFYKAIRKYGRESFNWCIIDSGQSREELNDKEIFWIKFYNSYIKFQNSNGYNMTIGGESLSGEDNPFYGKSHSLETKEKMSEKAKGRKHTELTKKKIGKILSQNYSGENNHMYGKKHKEETRKKMSEAHKGVKKTLEHRENISKAKFNKANSKSRGVVQLSLLGEFVAEYETINEAVRSVGSYDTNIIRNCKGETFSAKGYLWMYKDEYNEENVKKKLTTHTGGKTSKRRVVQLTIEGDCIAEYPTIIDAVRNTGADRNLISKCCNDNNKTHKGYKWMFKDDYERKCCLND